MVRVTDEEIIRQLSDNSRKPAAHIATALGVTETAIRKRIRKLEENGTITHYTIRTNSKKTGQVHVFIGVDSEPEYFINTIEFCKKSKHVIRAYTTSGDHTIQLECMFSNNEAFTEFVRALESQTGVIKVCPGIITDIIK